jgi:deoxyribose-phosphate aldolase
MTSMVLYGMNHLLNIRKGTAFMNQVTDNPQATKNSNITGPSFGASIQNNQVIQAIDHTKLTFKPSEDETQSIQKLCKEASDNGFFAVCVRPRHIQLAKNTLGSAPVKVATVIGFPLDKLNKADELAGGNQMGNFSTEEKVAETRQAVANGVDEIDLVINVAKLKAEASKTEQPYTLNELLAVKEAAQGRPIKVIIETDLLTDAETVVASKLCHQAELFMVKTCTGMVNGGTGATVPTVKLIRDTLDSQNSTLTIKASGGIKTLDQAKALMEVGATRLGTSAGVEIKAGLKSTQDY